MLRMYVAQQCFGLSDEGIEDAIYDSQAIRAFVGIDLNRESAPDATTLLKFRHLLEAKGLTQKIFEAINAHLAAKGLMMREGTIVDATLIAAPPSTKNKDGERDPEMHQSKKGNDWHLLDGRDVRVTASGGISLYPEDGEDGEALLKSADTAMYRAKERGRDNFQLFSPAMAEKALERRSLEDSLKRRSTSGS